MRLLSKIVLACIVFTISNLALADTSLLERADVQQFIDKLVTHDGFDRHQLMTVFQEAKIQPKIIASMEKPYEKKNWDVYQALFLTAQRLQEGIAYWQANAQALAVAEKQFHVPASIIVAIIGVETQYGKHQGNYRVLDALTTLAFAYPKRAAFFTKELEEYLLLCREQGVPATEYLGSYAGAIGKPQFMPSSYRYYAVDFSGKGMGDLVNDDKDVIASVANYFRKHGWKWGQPIAQPAQVKGVSYRKIDVAHKSAIYSLRQMLAAGVQPIGAPANPALKVGLIELTTAQGLEYWMAFPNFYVITRYNVSPQYALVVYLLSQQLQSQWLAAGK